MHRLSEKLHDIKEKVLPHQDDNGDKPKGRKTPSPPPSPPPGRKTPSPPRSPPPGTKDISNQERMANLLCVAAKANEKETVKAILVDRGELSLANALWGAATAGHADVVALLLEAKALPADDDCTESDPPLLSAVKGQHVEVVRLLLEAKGNPSGGPMCISCCSPTQPIEFASRNDSMAIVKMLLDAKADVNEASAQRPLANACTKGNLEMARLLLDSKADINHVYTYDHCDPPYHSTALDCAVKSGNLELVELLESRGAVRFEKKPAPEASDGKPEVK